MEVVFSGFWSISSRRCWSFIGVLGYFWGRGRKMGGLKWIWSMDSESQVGMTRW